MNIHPASIMKHLFPHCTLNLLILLKKHFRHLILNVVDIASGSDSGRGLKSEGVRGDLDKNIVPV